MNRWILHRFDTIDSTNAQATTFAHAQLTENPAAPLDHHVFIARTQSAGRGQYDRTFLSPPGGLYMTVILDHIPPELRAPLPLIIGLAVAEALDPPPSPPVSPAAEPLAQLIRIKIRWPNDLVIDDQKIAGILCEGLSFGDRWLALVGIGINVNTDPADLAPPKAHFRATSLLALDNHPRPLNTVAQNVLDALENLPAHDWQARFAPRDALRSRSVVVSERNNSAADGSPTHRIEGLSHGIGSAGELLLGDLSVARGSIQSIDGHSIRDSIPS